MCCENCANRDQQVHEFTGEEAKSVSIELVVNVLLKMSQHSTHFLLGVVHNSAGGPYSKAKHLQINLDLKSQHSF